MGFGPLPGAPDSSVVLVEGPWTHRTVRANGIALHVAEFGTGPLVLLLHGFPQFWWGWHQQLLDLADAGYRAVAVDLRGYGASDKPPRGYDSPTLAADMAALVDLARRVRRDGRRQRRRRHAGAGRWPRAIRGSCAALVVLGAAHPLRMRAQNAPRAPAARSGSASAYALRTFQVPRRAENLLSRDSQWVRELYDRWTGPRWRGTPRYVADVERYAQAMRIHPVSYCAAEHYRWEFRSLFRSDGRRYAASMRAPGHRAGAAPARRLRHLRAAGHRAGVRAVRHRRVRVAGPRRRRALPAQRGARVQVSGELVRWAKTH